MKNAYELMQRIERLDAERSRVNNEISNLKPVEKKQTKKKRFAGLRELVTIILISGGAAGAVGFGSQYFLEGQPATVAAGRALAAHEISKNPSRVANRKGMDYLQEGEYEKAASEFEKACKLEPNVANYHYNLGCAYRLMLKQEEASEEFRAAIKLEPDFKEAKDCLEKVIAK